MEDTKEKLTQTIINNINLNNDRLCGVVDGLTGIGDTIFGCQPQECPDEKERPDASNTADHINRLLQKQSRIINALEHEFNRLLEI